MSRFQFVACVMLLTLCLLPRARACPFCSAVSQTFSEEMKTMDVVAITELTQAALITELNTGDPTAEVPQSKFRITKVLKGQEFIKLGDSFSTIYFGEAHKERPYLAMATDAPNLMWSTPLILSTRAETYLLALHQLPETPERLGFFQDYLEDPDEMLARDAYDEFAKAPYADVIALKDKMNREKLLSFVQNDQVPSNRRRLYFTMLGVCGTPEDARLLEKLMVSEDRKQKAGLDAMLACYIILKGEDGLQQVDDLFLANKKAEYADTYAAIMAVRFHMTEVKVVPSSRLNESLRLMLDRPELADLVIPDLARAEDWAVMERLVKLFKDADENSSWVRVPVVNYLRACPLPEAAKHIEQLKAVDPDAVKRAMTFFPLATKPEEPKADDKSTAPQATEGDAPATEPAPTTSSGYVPQSDTLVAVVSATEAAPGKVAHADESLTSPLPDHGSARPVSSEFVDSPKRGSPVAARMDAISSRELRPTTLRQAERLAGDGTNIWVLMGVTLFSGCLCLIAMRSLLGCGSQN